MPSGGGGLVRGADGGGAPAHLGVIMDGHRRWALANGYRAERGYERGVGALRTCIECCRARGVRALTVFALSLDNLTARSGAEVGFLMGLMEDCVKRELGELHRNGVRLHFVGDARALPASLRAALAEAEARTAGNSALHVSVCLAYSGQRDIVRVARELALEAYEGRLRPEEIDERLIGDRLATGFLPRELGLPSRPDLLLRTGGQLRLSNFLLWETAYTELCFLDKMWPDLVEEDLLVAFRDYASRQRRFGA